MKADMSKHTPGIKVMAMGTITAVTDDLIRGEEVIYGGVYVKANGARVKVPEDGFQERIITGETYKVPPGNISSFVRIAVGEKVLLGYCIRESPVLNGYYIYTK